MFFNSVFQQEEVANILTDTLQSIKLSDRGVYVQASTLGSLEALLEFLRTSKIPVSSFNSCPVQRTTDNFNIQGKQDLFQMT